MRLSKKRKSEVGIQEIEYRLEIVDGRWEIEKAYQKSEYKR
jgi:hypothetical protein